MLGKEIGCGVLMGKRGESPRPAVVGEDGALMAVSVSRENPRCVQIQANNRIMIAAISNTLFRVKFFNSLTVNLLGGDQYLVAGWDGDHLYLPVYST